MTLTIGNWFSPFYTCLSTDVVGGKVVGLIYKNSRIYVVDTGQWFICDENLVLQPYAEPITTGALTIGSVDGVGVSGSPSGGLLTVQGDPSGSPVPIQLASRYADLQVDTNKYSFVSGDEFHYRVHSGTMWSNSYYTNGLSTNATVTIGITTGLKEVHIAFIHTASGDGKVEYYGGSVAFTGGTNIPSLNHDLSIVTQPLSSVTLSPSISGAGTKIRTVFIAGGSGGNRSGGSTTPLSAEFIIGASTQAYFVFTNLDGANGIYNMLADFYEV